MGIPTVTRFGILDRMPQAVPLHSAVLHTLGQIGPAASNALPTLIAESKDTNHPGRFEAALARWQIDGQTDDAKAVFRPGLQHTNRLVRQKAVAFLSRLGIPALPELIDALTNDNARVRIDAIDALATCGPAATAAAPRLEETLSDGKYIVRRQAAAALQKIRGQSQPRPSMDSSTQSAKGAP
jgi:HEAT repeat protein